MREARSRPNGFSTMTRAPLAQSGLAELLDDCAEERWRDRQVVGRVLGVAESLPQRGESRRVGVVAVDVAQQAAQLVEGGFVDAAVFLEAVAWRGLSAARGSSPPWRRR